MEDLPSSRLPRTNLINQLQEFRIEITRRAALAFLLITGASAWMILSFNPFPLPAFITLLAAFILSWWIRSIANDHPNLSRYLLFGISALVILTLTLVTEETWIPFIALPVVFLASILVQRGELIVAAAAWLLPAYLTWSGARSYPMQAFSIALLLAVLIAWVLTFMVNTSLSWYQHTLNQSNQLLNDTRQHRGELSKALKNLTLANDLQRRTEQELIQARRGAEEARITKEKFAARVSHELRTPLALIAGFSEVMYNSPEIYGDINWTPTMRRDISQVYHNANHLLSMVDDILNLSRVEIASFSIALEDTPITALLEESASIAADLFSATPVRFYTEIPQNLPVLRLDRTRIRQVILNLINNARRFTERGEVCLSARTAEQEIIISVRDTGPGIPPDKLEAIFQEFYQVEDRLLRNRGGTGLGLAICRHFVETHGGRIWAESELHRGSVFRFALPLNQLVLEQSPSELTPAEATQPRILLLGGDDHILALLRSELTAYEILPLDDETRLQQAVAYWHPHAVLCNDLPDEPPAQLNHIAHIPLPIIHCSLPSTLWLVKKLGIQACLAKPITSQVLSRQLAQISNPRSILIVDDDPDFVQLVERILQSLGSEQTIASAANGIQALEYARATPPDLILLDLTMPQMDGFEVIGALKAEPATAAIPVILLTATLTPERLITFPTNRLWIERSQEFNTPETLNLLRAILAATQTHYAQSTEQILADLNPQ